MSEEVKVPNPGSKEAQELGCKCPVLDNEHGIESRTAGMWWISEDCELHNKGKGGEDE